MVMALRKNRLSLKRKIHLFDCRLFFFHSNTQLFALILYTEKFWQIKNSINWQARNERKRKILMERNPNKKRNLCDRTYSFDWTVGDAKMEWNKSIKCRVVRFFLANIFLYWLFVPSILFIYTKIDLFDEIRIISRSYKKRRNFILII